MSNENKFKIIFYFEDEALRDEFIGYMSDGGGEQNFNMYDHIANFDYSADNTSVEVSRAIEK